MAISRRTFLTGTAATAVVAACGVPVVAKTVDMPRSAFMELPTLSKESLQWVELIQDLHRDIVRVTGIDAATLGKPHGG